VPNVNSFTEVIKPIEPPTPLELQYPLFLLISFGLLFLTVFYLRKYADKATSYLLYIMMLTLAVVIVSIIFTEQGIIDKVSLIFRLYPHLISFTLIFLMLFYLRRNSDKPAFYLLHLLLTIVAVSSLIFFVGVIIVFKFGFWSESLRSPIELFPFIFIISLSTFLFALSIPYWLNITSLVISVVTLGLLTRRIDTLIHPIMFSSLLVFSIIFGKCAKKINNTKYRILASLLFLIFCLYIISSMVEPFNFVMKPLAFGIYTATVISITLGTYTQNFLKLNIKQRIIAFSLALAALILPFIIVWVFLPHPPHLDYL